MGKNAYRHRGGICGDIDHGIAEKQLLTAPEFLFQFREFLLKRSKCRFVRSIVDVPEVGDFSNSFSVRHVDNLMIFRVSGSAVERFKHELSLFFAKLVVARIVGFTQEMIET